MLYQRDKLLNDLRSNIIKITLNNGVEIRSTLMLEHLPKNFVLNEQHKETDFHEKNKNLIQLWNVHDKKWNVVDISLVVYAEDVSDRH